MKENETNDGRGRAVEKIADERDFERFLIDTLYRLGQFADFGDYSPQRGAILEDIARLREWVDRDVVPESSDEIELGFAGEVIEATENDG